MVVILRDPIESTVESTLSGGRQEMRWGFRKLTLGSRIHWQLGAAIKIHAFYRAACTESTSGSLVVALDLSCAARLAGSLAATGYGLWSGIVAQLPLLCTVLTRTAWTPLAR